MYKLVLIGSECSGKTSLAKDLASHFQTDFLEEYSRLYAEEKKSRLTFDDVMLIARGQILSEKDFIKKSNGAILIFDTCIISTYIYSKIYYKKVPDRLIEKLKLDRYDQFFLTYPDPEWEEDGIRNLPMSRMKMHEIFKSELESFNLPYIELKGNKEQRLNTVIREIKNQI